MGLETTNVLSDERHYGAFLCPVCTNLCGLDAVVTAGCSHVFCKLCLETWLKRSDKCPLCSREQPQQIPPQPLQLAQPVAYRVLSRIQVICPLPKQPQQQLQQHLRQNHNHVRCSWKGDYGDLQAHLLSSTAHVVSSAAAPLLDGEVRPQSTSVNGSPRTQNCINHNENDGTAEDHIMYDEDTDHNTSLYDLANAFKEEANAKFSSANFTEARDLYSKGIDILMSNNNNTATATATRGEQNSQLLATLYANRAATALRLEEYWDCRSDCDMAIRLDPTYIKAYSRRTKACFELGQFDDAVEGLQQACSSNPESSRLRKDLQHAISVRDQLSNALQLLETNQHQDASVAQTILGKLLLQGETNAPVVVIAAARANVLLGQTETAQRLSLQVLRRHPQFAPAFVVRGHSLCWAGDFDSGLKVIREGLRLDPDNEVTKTILRSCKRIQQSIQEARTYVFHRKFLQAVEAFGHAVEELGSTKAPLYAILHSERAEVHLRLKDYEKALRDAGRAIYARDDLEQAWLTKTKALQGLGRNLEAREELEDLLRNKWGSNSVSIRKAYENADFLVRKEQRPDFYGLLGVSPIASLMEIKKQYKVKAMEYHPDKWMSAGDVERKEAEHKFKLLGEGLEILSDDFQRQLYDEGYDSHAIRERVAAAQQAAHRPQNYHHGHH